MFTDYIITQSSYCSDSKTFLLCGHAFVRAEKGHDFDPGSKKSKFHYNKPIENSPWIAHSAPCQFWQDMIKLNGGWWWLWIYDFFAPETTSFWVSYSFSSSLIQFHERHRFYFKSWYQSALCCWERCGQMAGERSDAGLEALDSGLNTCRPSWWTNQMVQLITQVQIPHRCRTDCFYSGHSNKWPYM